MSFTGNFTTDSFKTALLNGDVNFTEDTLRIALYTNAATLDATTTGYTADGEVVAAGYTAGGELLTPTVSTTGGTSFVSFADVSWSSAITARGALIYKVGGTAVCILDFGSDKTSTTNFSVGFPPNTNTSAVLRLN